MGRRFKNFFNYLLIALLAMLALWLMTLIQTFVDSVVREVLVFLAAGALVASFAALFMGFPFPEVSKKHK